MAKPQDSLAGSATPAREGRLTPRRKLTEMAYVELTEDNGGILLNLSESGLAVQCALTLNSKEFPDLRFQLPNMRGWLTVSGRVAWMSESKKEAGIAFLDLHPNARAQIRHWVETGMHAHPQSPQHENRESKASSSATRDPNRDNRERPDPAFSPNKVDPVPERPIVNNAAPEQQSQNFTFHDYSMFAVDPTAGDLWMEPPKPRAKWGSLAVLAILIAALFFILGATIRNGQMDQLLAYVENWIVVAQRASSNDTAAPSTPKSQDPGPQSPVTNSEAPPNLPTPVPSGVPPTKGDGGNAGAEIAQNPQQRLEGEKTPSQVDPANDGFADRRAHNAASKPEPPPAPEAPHNKVASASTPQVTSRDTYYSSTPTPDSSGQSLLVNAPAPGNPPLFVNLPGEAVSASSTVAITARRSIQVPARTNVSEYGPQRVVVGRLLAHSDPYYPLDARSKRVEGIVELHAVVGRTGLVISVTPMSGPAPLVAAAATALHEWRYEPTYVAGDPVETHADVTMVFRAR